jgi:asparagine synthetase A
VYYDDTPVFELLFESTVNLCERFPALTPLSLRKEKAREVFLLIVRYNNYGKKQGKKKKIRKPAGDDWF